MKNLVSLNEFIYRGKLRAINYKNTEIVLNSFVITYYVKHLFKIFNIFNIFVNKIKTELAGLD